MAIKHLHTPNEIKEYLKIGMWHSFCCREEIGQIKTQEDIDELIELLKDDEEDKDDDPLWTTLTIADTFEEIWEVME